MLKIQKSFSTPKTKAIDHTQQRSSSLFPQEFKKAKEDACFKNFFDTFKELRINLSLQDVLQGMR